jgi:hypothetical protein
MLLSVVFEAYQAAVQPVPGSWVVVPAQEVQIIEGYFIVDMSFWHYSQMSTWWLPATWQITWSMQHTWFCWTIIAIFMWQSFHVIKLTGSSSMQWFGEQHPLEKLPTAASFLVAPATWAAAPTPKSSLPVPTSHVTKRNPRHLASYRCASPMGAPWHAAVDQLLPKPLSSVMTPTGIPTAASVTHNNSLGATSITILLTGAAGNAALRTPLEMIRFVTSSQDWLRRSLLQEWSNSQQALKIIAD